MRRDSAFRGLIVSMLIAQLIFPACTAAEPGDSTQQGAVDLRDAERRAEKAPVDPPGRARLREGDRVRLLLATRGEPVEGRLVRVGDSGWVIRSLGDEDVIAAADVREVWVRRTRTRDATIMLGLVGMVAGGLYGLNELDGLFCPVQSMPGAGVLTTSYRCPDHYTEGDALVAAAAGTVLGVFCGLLVGTLSASWEQVVGTPAPAR